MKVIFLDVDGVLNADDDCVYQSGPKKGEWKARCPLTNKVTSVVQYKVRNENRRSSFEKETITVSDTDLFKTKEEVAKHLMTLVAERIADQLKELEDLENGGSKDELCF